MSLSIETLVLDLDDAGVGYRSHRIAQLREVGASEETILDAVKAYLKVAIDVEAERIRLTLVTPGSGQAMEYGEAQAQAAAALAEPGTATAQLYPMLAASIGLDIDPMTLVPATDVVGVARSVQAARDLWLVIGADIRRVRLATKRDVDAAETVEAALAVLDAVAWPVLG